MCVSVSYNADKYFPDMYAQCPRALLFYVCLTYLHFDPKSDVQHLVAMLSFCVLLYVVMKYDSGS